MTERGLLIVFSWPSGVGKDTVLRAFMPRCANCALSISTTTRLIRRDETDGVAYNFVSREAFESMIAAGELLEYAEFAGNYYGTPASWVEEKLNEGKNVILEIELRGAARVRELRPEALFVFLMPPSLKILEERLRRRGTEDEAEIKRRLKIAKEEIKLGESYDFVIVNEDIERTCGLLAAVVSAAPCHVKYGRDALREVLKDA
ncbi:MAG: guanylate kinase [Oscillospiraceae bacterium]|jgi:guanylate kinase|nr:guanylate kinase [Oscillospiraceae bacterium]